MGRVTNPSDNESEDHRLIKKKENMVDSSISSITKYIQDVAKGRGRSSLEALMLEGLKIIHIGKGILRCKLRITDRVSGEDGVWQAGAITSVMDMIGAAVVFTAGDGLHVSLDLNTSFYSTAKIQEEVEVEGRVVATKASLKGAVVEIRREGNGEVIATGRIWMSQLSLKVKDEVTQLSKL
ncbi:unnamed protein product [Thlaspi arvense]|uniref:Acyl-coenzyme A thioesterase 13 n=1 Tax=Thlaspi arvense TaxID=13288 RepID=A0AAU9R913_THLAR|nr:unnamed protein product [Thlaspi arvense]